MKNTKCSDCKGSKMCAEDNTSWLIIIIGLISTVAIRVVTILIDIDPILGKVAWYVGIVGFVIFFVYKYRVFKKRARIIENRHLVEKLDKKLFLELEDYEAMAIILCNIKSNRERINFLFIFISSFISLLVAIYFDFLI